MPGQKKYDKNGRLDLVPYFQQHKQPRIKDRGC